MKKNDILKKYYYLKSIIDSLPNSDIKKEASRDLELELQEYRNIGGIPDFKRIENFLYFNLA